MFKYRKKRVRFLEMGWLKQSDFLVHWILSEMNRFGYFEIFIGLSEKSHAEEG